MDNDALLKIQMNSIEDNESGLVERINQKIDDIQSILNDRQQQDVDKKEEIIAWAKEAIEIINASLSEVEILKKLEDLYKKIQGDEDRTLVSEIEESVKKKNEKEKPLHSRLKQEVVDIIHTSERGIPMFVSNNMKKTAGEIGITIEEKDKPNDVIEKMKKRLNRELVPKIEPTSIIPEKILEERGTLIEDKKENPTKGVITKPTSSDIFFDTTKKTKQKEDDEKVAEVKKQIEELLNNLSDPQKKEIAEQIAPIIEESKNDVTVEKEETLPVIEEPKNTFVVEKEEIVPVTESKNSTVFEKGEMTQTEEEPEQTFIVDEEEIIPVAENKVISEKEEKTPIIETKIITVTEKKEENILPKKTITVSDRILAELG